MKETVLIILNYQREIPPFILNELKVAKDHFNKVFYVTPYLYNDNSSIVQYSNVSVCQGNQIDKLVEAIMLPFSLFNFRVLKEILKAVQWKRISKAFIKSFLQYLGASNYLVSRAEKIIKKNKNRQIYVLGAWMNAEGYAAARLKNKNSGIYAATLAHSFEVNPFRDVNVDLHMNIFVHSMLDNINFISNSVYELYKAYAMKKYNLEGRNITFYHLGCEKVFNLLNKPSDDESFRIVSCSSVLSNKRLDRLLGVLANWKKGNIIWTHIGDGPDFQKIKQEASLVVKKNTFVKIDLLGKKNNKEVHRFYVENKVDLFVNISEFEGLPVSLMECMAYGIPAIATDAGGNKEIVNAENGFLIPLDFSDKYLLDIIRKYSEMDAQKVQAYRQNAFNQWKNNYDGKKNITDRYRNIMKIGKCLL